MVKNGKGGANTNKNGLEYESKVDIEKEIKKISKMNKKYKDVYEYSINNNNYIYTKKHGFNRYLEEEFNIIQKDILSKQLLPDNLVINLTKKEFRFIEVKYQNVSGSTDEKIQTCGFKLRQFNKLLKPLGFKVTYTYILNEWFQKDRYKDDLEYIKECGGDYYFNKCSKNIICN